MNLWTLEESSQSFTIVDIKPANMEDLTEARKPPIRSASEPHPASQHRAASAPLFLFRLFPVLSGRFRSFPPFSR